MSQRAILFCCLFLLTAMVAAPIDAGSITVYSPFMVDTSAQYQPIGSMGTFGNLSSLIVGRGDSVNLIAVNASPAQLAYPVLPTPWSAIRTDASGVLLDSIPRLLIQDSAIAVNFQPLTIEWRAPYFWVYGTYAPPDPAPSGLAYIRLHPDLAMVDSSPIACGRSVAFWPADRTTYHDDFWQIYRGNTLTAWLSDVSTGSQPIADLRLTGRGQQFVASAASKDGLFVSAKDSASYTMLNTLVGRDGMSTILDSVTFSDTPKPLFRSLTGLRYRDDSALVCMFDTTSSGQRVLRYFFLSADNAVDSVTTYSISLPFLKLESWREFAFFLEGDTLYAVSSYSVDVIDLYQFSISESRLLQAVTLAASGGPDYGAFGGAFGSGGFLHYYYRRSQVPSLYGQGRDVQRVLISPTDPAAIVSSEPIFRVATHFRHPTLLADGTGISVFSQIATGNEYHMIFHGLDSPEGGGNLVSEHLMVGQKPHNPEIAAARGKKVLFWDEQVPDTSTGGNGVAYQNRLVLFDGSFPTASDLAGEHTLRQLRSSYGFHPSVALIDSCLYFTQCVYFIENLWEVDVSSRLRSINLNSNVLTPLSLEFNTNGLPTLLAAHDSAIWVASIMYCTDHNNISCLAFDQTYYANYVAADSIARWSWFRNYNVWNSWPFPSDVMSTLGGAGYILALQDDQSLYEFDTTAQSFARRQNLMLYVSGLGRCSLYPVETPSAHCVIAMSEAKTTMKLLAFDLNWNFAGSLTITPTGVPREYSQFVYDSASGRIVFAYSSFVADRYASSRLFLQSVSVNVVTDVNDPETSLPNHFSLAQNYPNPFNPSTIIQYDLPQRTHVTLTIYNILGEEVAVLVNKTEAAGAHELTWTGTDSHGHTVASGIYLYRLEAGRQSSVRKMVLLK